MDAPFGSWGTQTFIAGLSADAMIAPLGDQRCHASRDIRFANALSVIDGAAFAAYVNGRVKVSQRAA